MKRLIFIVVLWILGIIGEIMCVYKAYKCNWEPIGKAEIVYTVSAFTGFGCIVGYLDIKDN